MHIINITKLQPGVYAHICPLCGEVYASASELEMMPEFSICECDRNGNKQPTHELFDRDGHVWIRRNKYPRFVGPVPFGQHGQQSDIENVEWLDDCDDSLETAKAMRKAGEFLIKVGKDGTTRDNQ